MFICAGILEQSMGARKRVGLCSLADRYNNPVPKSVPSPNKIVIKFQHWIFKRRGGVGGGVGWWVRELNLLRPEPVFLNVYGAQESIPRNEFRQPM
jgi:hypothetical protein